MTAAGPTAAPPHPRPARVAARRTHHPDSRAWFIAAAFIVALNLPTSPCRATTPDADVWGRNVIDIKIQGDAGLSVSAFAAEIVQQKNQPLDRDKVAESLKRLFATGRFANLLARAEPSGAGVILIFDAKARYFYGVVEVQGSPKDVDPALLESTSGLRLGAPASTEEIDAARARLQAQLAASSYHEAKLTSGEEWHPENQEVDVTFVIVPGHAARLAGVTFSGDPLFGTSTLLKQARWKPGIQLTSARLERGLSRLRSFYDQHDHLEAALSAEKRTYDAGKRTEQLTVRVQAGPQVRIHVEGVKLSAGALQAVLPAYRQASADTLTLTEGEGALASYFEAKGYYSVVVKLLPNRSTSSAPRAPDPSLDITYTVKLGPRGRFAGYAFKGNHAIAGSALAAVVTLQPSDPLASRHGRFDHDSLDTSVQAIAGLYQSSGFRAVRVTPKLDQNYGGHAGDLFVTFNIEEGNQTRVRELTLLGLDPGLERQMRSILSNLPGKPYSGERARSDRDAILAYLNNHGYEQATVTWTASEPTLEDQVDVSYRVTTGPQATISRVVVLGNEHTRDAVIERQIQLAAGQPLNQSAFLSTQQRLYDLGLFSEVQVAVQNPASAQAGQTVLVGVEEAKRWTLGYGGGLDVQRLPGNGSQGQYGASPRVSLELDRINVGGRPQIFTLTGHISNLEKIGSSSYDIPHFLDRPGLDLRFSLLTDQSRDVLTFNSKRQEADITLQKRYSTHASILVRYNFRHVTPYDLQITAASIPLFNQSVLVATIGGSYVNDHRNDPIDATRGSYTALDADVAWNKIGSSANFGRLIAQNSTFLRLAPHLVFARNTRIGLEPRFGPQPSIASGLTPLDQVLEGVPLPERFYMGGADSDRAFSLNEAGPRDPITGYPLGGRGEFLNQMEMRVPFQQDRLGVVFFEDAGNVFSTYTRMRLLKFSQSSPTDFDYDVQSAGIGLRYRTPVGPLRFDVGYSPNIPSYYVCSNANATICPGADVEVLRLPRFQFVLSVGQSF